MPKPIGHLRRLAAGDGTIRPPEPHLLQEELDMLQPASLDDGISGKPLFPFQYLKTQFAPFEPRTSPRGLVQRERLGLFLLLAP